MENPLLGLEPLPAFARIRPEHVEPGVRELLERSRVQIEKLAAVERPTFATVIEPLEELQHRVSRTWSPISHLNAVLNSDALRTGYNACLPLLSAYQTDLAQSEPLYRAYLLKEQFREIFSVGGQAGKVVLAAWLRWAARCQIPAFVRLAKRIRHHLPGIHATLDNGLSNARIEANNTHLRVLTRQGYGYHSAEALIAMAMLRRGGLCPPLPGRATT